MFSRASSGNRASLSRKRFTAVFLILPCFFAFGQDSLSHLSPDSLLSAARKNRSLNDISTSILAYRQYLENHPNDIDVRNELARTFAWDAQYDSALATYDEVLRSNSRNFDACFGRCQTLAWKGDYQVALQETDTLLLHFPGNIDALLLAARLHKGNRDFVRALELYHQVFAEDDQNIQAMLGLCAALLGMGKVREAYDEILAFRVRASGNEEIEKLYRELSPKPRNQLFLRFQDEHFDAQGRNDFRTIEVQYYRTLASDLTIFAQGDSYRRFDQDDQSVGAGVYYTVGSQESLYGYILASPNPQATSRLDALVEYEHGLSGSTLTFVSYRVLAFKTETAHTLSPGFTWSAIRPFELRPRVFISRTIIGKTTSYAFLMQATYNESEVLVPYLFYSVGNEAYRGVTLDNIESAHSWSITFGAKLVVSTQIIFRANYQYLNRIGQFRENSFDLGLGYLW